MFLTGYSPHLPEPPERIQCESDVQRRLQISES